MFIIPVKMKWMAIFYVVIIAYEMIQDIVAGSMVFGDPDCGFSVEFHYFLLWNKGFQPV